MLCKEWEAAFDKLKGLRGPWKVAELLGVSVIFNDVRLL
jgi:hypothetical protein